MTAKRKRREFPKSVRLAAWERCGGRCEGDDCEKKLFTGKFVYDHIVPDALGGEPVLDNCKVLCANEPGSCNHKKTFGAKGLRLDADNSKIAKADRTARKFSSPLKAKMPKGRHVWPKRSLRSRSSLSGGQYLKKVDGTVVRRDAS